MNSSNSIKISLFFFEMHVFITWKETVMSNGYSRFMQDKFFAMTYVCIFILLQFFLSSAVPRCAKYEICTDSSWISIRLDHDLVKLLFCRESFHKLLYFSMFHLKTRQEYILCLQTVHELYSRRKVSFTHKIYNSIHNLLEKT